MENNCPHCFGFRPPAAKTCSHCGKYGADSLKEILRLTQELEAAKRETAEARDKALEEAEVKFSAMAQADIERAERMKDRDPEMANICRDFAGGYIRAAAEIRALKSNHESKDTLGGA